ncbi:hypothetical protein B7P43_G15298 [Cryptotermes secundus]|uniref:Uncharacterized protein n=1 Tax=Cryptotermes secundus TaxID=105785 RepID=A0A2J7PIQ4_9NEOP|nr:hypothetical protein B7P43_G15298 [Cryptotermes secundus]
MVILMYDCDGVILTYYSPTADHQCAVLLFIFGTQPATSFEKEAVTLSAEPTHHFAEQCSAACSSSCG